MSHVIAPKRAIGQTFSITLDDEWLGEHLDVLLAALPRAERAEVAIVVSGEPGGYRVTFDGESVLEDTERSSVVNRLVQRLNALATASPGFVCAHASGVARDGVAYVFPAHMESGKTTLAAGLVRAGFDYLTDEAVAFDPATSLIEPYPKPLSIDRGSWPLFPEGAPDPELEHGKAPDQWQVPVARLRAGAVGSPCRARFVVFPSYREGATTELVPMTRGHALVELAKNTFAFNEQGRVALDALADVVRGAECARMSVGSLDDAVACIEGLT
jgi:hypothetical protein